MKVTPTLEGGLRIDAEDDGDWKLLLAVTHDAICCQESLGKRLGGLITDEESAADWREFVVPDLDEIYDEDLTYVGVAITTARNAANSGRGSLWITPEDSLRWYGVFNQARLALEEIYHFGETGEMKPESLPKQSRNSLLRVQFYFAIQSLLLEHVLC
jgi:hypothetical protein